MARLAKLALGVALAAAGSQIPEYAQQYRQRLGGAVDELRTIVLAFDADAAREGLDRNGALERHRRSPDPFFQRRGHSMEETIVRFDRLRVQLTALTEAGPFTRLAPLVEQLDGDVARRALSEFEPALPLTGEGLAFMGFGFLGGWLAAAGGGRLLRRREATTAPTVEA